MQTVSETQSCGGMRLTSLPGEVMQVLRSSSISAEKVFLPKMEKSLYRQVHKVLTELGGSWNSKADAHLFPCEADVFLNPVLESGKMIFARKQDYFPTPPEIIEQMFFWSEIKSGMSVLEPNAGGGAIACELRDYFGKHISLDLVEINPKLVARLYQKGFTKENGYDVYCTDFLSFAPGKLYDRILMNPPFHDAADIDHVSKAFSLLKPGGVLTAIMSHGTTWHSDRKTTEFRRFIEPYEHFSCEYTNNEFRASGTNVKTWMVALIK